MATPRGSRGLRKIDGGIIPKMDKRGANPYVARPPVFGVRGSSLANDANRQDRHLPSGWGVGAREKPQTSTAEVCAWLASAALAGAAQAIQISGGSWLVQKVKPGAAKATF